MDNTKCTTVKTDKKEDHKLIHIYHYIKIWIPIMPLKGKRANISTVVIKYYLINLLTLMIQIH